MSLFAPAPRPARVTLRFATPVDAPLLHRWRGEPTVRRFQPLAEVSVAQLRSELAAQADVDLARRRGERCQWIIEVDGRAAGWITLVVVSWEHGLAEIGYALTTAQQGRGVMPQALTQLLAELFLGSSLERLEARCAIGNAASQRVLERVGFSREGLLRDYFLLDGQRVDNYLYAILRREVVDFPRR